MERARGFNVSLRFQATPGALAVEESVSLTLESFGDGSNNGKWWFRVMPRAQFALEREEACKQGRREMELRCNRIHTDEPSQGHCGRAAIARQQSFNEGKPLEQGATAVKAIHLGSTQQMIAQGLVENGNEIARLISGHHRDAGMKGALESRAREYLIRRARLCRSIKPGSPCSPVHWFGGENSCDVIASAMGLSKALGAPVHAFLLTAGTNSVAVYRHDGSMTWEDLSDINPSENDVVMEHV